MKYYKALASLALTLIGAPSIEAQDSDRDLVRIYGNPYPFALRLCEGRCDDDDDCRGSLVCFHRSNSQPAPGCSYRLSMPASVCVLPKYVYVADGDGDGSDGDGVDEGGGGDGGGDGDGASGGGDTDVNNDSDSGNDGNIDGESFGDHDPSALKACQGGCETDIDCRGNLVCFHRSFIEGAPGCSYKLWMPGANVCVPSEHGGSDGSGTGDGTADGIEDGGDNDDESFFLKLYWQPGYFWQEERIERKWCMRCRDGCLVNNDVAIFPCNENPTRWTFVNHGNETQIKVANTNVCLEAVFFPEELQREPAGTIDLKRCDPDNSLQRFVPTLGGFDEQRFEITPKNKPGWCLTQRHHPKYNERVELERCEPARQSNDETSMWNKY